MAKQKASERKTEGAAEVLQRKIDAYIAEKNGTYIEALRAVTRQEPQLWTNYKRELPTIQPTTREQLGMKAKARSYLLRVAAILDRWGPRDKCFSIGHQSSTVLKAAQRGVIIPDERPERLHQVMPGLATTGYRILETMAGDERVSNADLDVLTRVLNQHQDPIRFQPVSPLDPRPMYRRRGGLDVSFVDDLLNYMDLAARYGRQHFRCEREGCEALMISGRGGKRFCSNACRNQFWAYNRQKPYYIEKKALSDERLGKSASSSRTGRT